MTLIKTYPLLFGIVLLILPSSLFAFDDNSTDHTRNLVEIRRICENGSTVIDTEEIHYSCEKDSVYVSRRQEGLFKNNRQLTSDPVLDFKISRGGKVYYRTRAGPFLYNETGQLNSNNAKVRVYLISSSGDVVYLNENGDIFKNGVQLDRGPSRIPFRTIEKYLKGRSTTIIINPAISTNGSAVYLDENDNLFLDGAQINPHTSRVRRFKLNSQADAYYIDTAGRLFRNSDKLFDGRANIRSFRLNIKGQVAFLTDLPSNNLFFENQALSAGAHKISSFNFDSAGEVYYKDDFGRLWKSGNLIAK